MAPQEVPKEGLDVKNLQKALKGIPGLHEEGELFLNRGNGDHRDWVKGVEFTR